MTSFVAKLVAKKLLGETAQNRFGYEDPYFENVPATRLDGKPGRVRKQRKANPPGLSEHDGQVLTKVKRRAYRLDCKWSLMGFRFGVSSLIGIIPLIGDGFDILLACMVVRTCRQVEGGLPTLLILNMYFSILVDFVIGLIPIIGDLGDAAYKANTKNAARLEAFLQEKGAKNLSDRGIPLPDVNPSSSGQFERFQQQGTATFTPDPDGGSGPIREEEPVTTAEAAHGRQGGGGGLFGFLRRGGGRPVPDVERGTASIQAA